MSRRRAILMAVCVGCLLALSSLREGQPATPAKRPVDPQPPSGIVERATSEFVLIEVYVTDRKGRPIRGLTVADFVLKIDQQTRPKPIASLEYFEDRPDAGREERDASGEEPGTGDEETDASGKETDTVGAPASRDLPRRFVLFFDDATSAPMGLTAARRAAEEFIAAQLGPEDLVSLAAYDANRKLRILHDFTTDRLALHEAIRRSLDDPMRFSDFSAQREERRREMARILKPTLFGRESGASGGTSTFGGKRGSLEPEHEAESARFRSMHYAQEDGVRLRSVLRAVRTLVEALAPWPGYKAVVFMGEGIPENPGQDYYLLDATQSLTPELTSLAYAAGSSSVTLHTVTTTGLLAGNADEVKSASRRSNSLRTLALNTGGVAITSNDLVGALGVVEESSHAFYLLGYAPEGPPDGLYHSVNIKLKARRARLRYRKGFTRLLPGEVRERTVQAAHLVPELYPELGVQMSVVPGPHDGARRVADLVLYVPANRVLFLPQEEGLVARLEIGLVALGESGKETFRIARRTRIALSPDLIGSWKSLGLNFFTRVQLPAGSQSVTGVVSDLQGGTTGAERLAVAALGSADQGVLGLSLYSMSESSLWIELKPERGAKDIETTVSYSLGPSLRRRFARGEPLTCGFRVPATGAAPLQVAILQDGRVLRMRPLDEAEGNARGTIKVPLPVEGLPDGDYTLMIREPGPEGDTDLGRVPFAIEPGS